MLILEASPSFGICWTAADCLFVHFRIGLSYSNNQLIESTETLYLYFKVFVTLSSFSFFPCIAIDIYVVTFPNLHMREISKPCIYRLSLAFLSACGWVFQNESNNASYICSYYHNVLVYLIIMTMFWTNWYFWNKICRLFNICKRKLEIMQNHVM